LNALNGAAPDAVRDQAARHNPSNGMFNGAYMNERVRFNTQDAYLEKDVTEDGLTRSFAHMSLRCHPDAPSGAPPEVVRRLVDADAEIVILQRQFDELHNRLRADYKFIKRAPKGEKQEHDELGKKLKSEKKSLEDELHKAYRKDYFFRVHNEMMKMQLDPSMIEEPGVEPMVQHQLEERTRLQEVLCNFSMELTPQGIVARKVAAISLMVALASRRECQTRQPRQRPDAYKDPVKQESPFPEAHPLPPPDPFPLVCKKTQCIICLGDTRLTYEERTREFSRVSHMMTHVENHHLKRLQPGERPVCKHPRCSPKGEGLFFDYIEYFKNHVGTVHKINLRA